MIRNIQCLKIECVICRFLGIRPTSWICYFPLFIIYVFTLLLRVLHFEDFVTPKWKITWLTSTDRDICVSDPLYLYNVYSTPTQLEVCHFLILNILPTPSMFIFLTSLNLLNFLNGIIHLPFLELSIIIVGISRWKLKVGKPTVESLVWSDCAYVQARLALYWW